MSQRELELLQAVARALIRVSAEGARGGSREVAEHLQKLAEACRALQYKRLYWILEALATRVAHPTPDLAGAPLEELGRLLADARYTCKALKSYLTGKLEDQRLLENLLGSRGLPAGADKVESRSYLTLARNEWDEGGHRYRDTILADPTTGELSIFKEHRRLTDEGLDGAFTDLGLGPTVFHGELVPSFPPRRLRIQSAGPGLMNEGRLRDLLEEHGLVRVGRLLERFRTLREEYLAPRTLPVVFRPHRVDPTPPGAVWDEEGNVLSLLREPSTFHRVETLLRALQEQPEGVWGITGKLVFVTGRFLLHPWSLLRPDHDPPVLFL